MKNFNIMRVHWKIWFLGRIHEKPIHRGELPKEWGLGQFSGLWEGGFVKKRELVFLRGGWYPNAHYGSPSLILNLKWKCLNMSFWRLHMYLTCFSHVSHFLQSHHFLQGANSIKQSNYWIPTQSISV